MRLGYWTWRRPGRREALQLVSLLVSLAGEACHEVTISSCLELRYWQEGLSGTKGKETVRPKQVACQLSKRVTLQGYMA